MTKEAEWTNCPVEATLMLLGNRWKILILRDLLSGTKRFIQLKNSLPGISQKVLTQNLRDMEGDGLINRAIFAEVPPRVEYSLTEIGRSLAPIIAAMMHWGNEYRRSSTG